MPVKRIAPNVDGAYMRVAIVQSRFNPAIGEGLLAGALRALKEARVLQRLAQTGRYHALVALGAVIRGETYHYEIVCNESAAGVASVALESGVPIGNGILTCDTDAQALARMEQKGYEATQAALEMANLMRAIDDDR
jgi:6,7-dimethyl-8-ribityllumazine synthase